MHLPNLNYKVILIISLILLSLGIGLFVGFPKLLRKMIKSVSNRYITLYLQKFTFLFMSIKKQINVAPNSAIRPLYEKAPFFIDFRIRVFNITNKDEVIAGSECHSLHRIKK